MLVVFFLNRRYHKRQLREIEMRQKISRDLHDDIGATSAASRSMANWPISRSKKAGTVERYAGSHHRTNAGTHVEDGDVI